MWKKKITHAVLRFSSDDIHDINRMNELLTEDMDKCDLCEEIRAKGGPRHASGGYNPFNKTAYTYQCESGSRWYNPETDKMSGRAHCSCDSCF